MQAQQTSRTTLQLVTPAAADPLLRKVFIPREHGSWGMWLLPLLSGAEVGAKVVSSGFAVPVIWFLVASASAFLAYQPLEGLLSLSPLRARTSKERNLIGLWILGCAATCVLSLLQLWRLGRHAIFWFAVVGAFCFVVRWLFGSTRAFRTSKQVMGALALTSTAAGSYYVATAAISRTGMLLWFVFWLFSVAQIEFVQLCIRSANAKSRTQKLSAGRGILILHVCLVLGAVAASLGRLTPAFLGVCFVPALMRIVLWLTQVPQKINFRSLGFAELFQSVLFAGLVTVGFLLP